MLVVNNFLLKNQNKNLSLSASKNILHVLFENQVYGNRDSNVVSKMATSSSSLSVKEDPLAPLHLQLSQPQLQHYEMPGTTKLR